MNLNERRRAIAKIDGWNYIEESVEGEDVFGRSPFKDYPGIPYPIDRIPMYDTRDEMVSVISRQPSVIQEKVMFNLAGQVRFSYLATAEELQIALLKAKGAYDNK